MAISTPLRLILHNTFLVALQAALMWAKKYAADAADNNNADSEDADWRSLFREHFAPIIQYHKIAASVILEEIMPLGVVPDRDLLSALAYQVFSIINIL